MDFLKKAVASAKNHYEKLILSFAMVALALAVVHLYLERTKEEETLAGYVKDVERRSTKMLKPTDYTRFEQALKLAKTPTLANFSPPHHLLNPVKWLRNADGSYTKVQTGLEVGPARVVATNIRPLSFIVRFNRAAPGSNFFFNVENELPRRPTKREIYLKPGMSNNVLALLDFKGDPAQPVAFTLQLMGDSKEQITVTPDKPYTRVEAYEADLKYQVDGKEYSAVRDGTSIRVGDEEYKIVAVRESEVVLSHPNGKQHRVKLAPAQ